MPGYWSVTNRGTTGVAATATQSFAPASAVGGQQVRLRRLQCAIAGQSAGQDTVVVRDGASGVGAIIWQADLALNANASSLITADLDLRASIGNNLTIEFLTGVAADREDVNAQGDFVPVGWPLGVS